MAEYAFLMQKVDQWRKDMAHLWGEPQYLPSAAPVPTPLPLSGRTVLPEWP